VLYTSPQGYLTLVETKLWRNPQARREVVGQIVDYAKELANWSFDDLDEAVRQAKHPTGMTGKGILELLDAEDKLGDESHVIDTITRNLQRGRLLLLIVGDGIRERVEAISSYLQDTPGLHFALALLELALYQMEPGQEWPVLVQPRLVARTVEVVRAVVKVKAPPELEVEVQLPETEEKSAKKGRRTLTESMFFEELAERKGQNVADQVADLVDELTEMGLVKSWGSGSVSMRLPDPRDTGKRFTVVVLRTAGDLYLGWLSYVHTRGGYDRRIPERYLEAVAEMTGASIGTLEDYPDTTSVIDVEVLLQNRDEFLAAVREFKSAIEAEAAERE
jgi:hypothetical protein